MHLCALVIITNHLFIQIILVLGLLSVLVQSLHVDRDPDLVPCPSHLLLKGPGQTKVTELQMFASLALLPLINNRKPSATALTIAKRHMDSRYTVVGTLEDLPRFLQLLEATLPSYFAGVANLHATGMPMSFIVLQVTAVVCSCS